MKERALEETIIKAFFKIYNIKETEITLKIKEDLESFLITKEYQDEVPPEAERKFYLGGCYELTYKADQWYGADLCKLVYEDNRIYPKAVYRGEGDSLTEALLDLYLEAEELFDEDDKEYIRGFFEEE